MSTFYVGVDLAQTQDYTVLVFVEQYTRVDLARCYDVRQVVRLARKQSFFDQCEQIAAMVDNDALGKNATVIYDRTGIGAAVAELLTAAVRKRKCRGIVITGGQKDGWLDNYTTVPKRDLVATTQVLIGDRRLQIAATPACRGLVRELEQMRVTVNPQTGYESFAAPPGEHDDRALAAMLALWWAEKRGSHRIGVY